MIKNIVFDIGNVMVGFDWKQFIEKFGWSDEVSAKIANATVHAKTWHEIDRGVMTEDEVLEAFIANDPSVESELRAFYEDFSGMLNQFEYAKGWIIDLKRRGFKVYCLSNMSFKAVRECADALDFLPMLDCYILSCNEGLIKPQKEIYQLFFERFNLKPEECLFFDDLERNVNAARDNGMNAEIFTDVKSAEASISEYVKKDAANGALASKYTKGQRIAALICIAIIVLLYLATLVFAIIKADWAKVCLRIGLGCTLVLPILTWVYIWMIGKLTKKKTIADFNFFEK